MTDFQFRNSDINSHSIITEVHSEFDDIYRITTECGLIIDLYVVENDPDDLVPTIGTTIIYNIVAPMEVGGVGEVGEVGEVGGVSGVGEVKATQTVLNGIIYDMEHGTKTIYVSFGGLLAKIPFFSNNFDDWKAGDKLCLTYYLS